MKLSLSKKQNLGNKFFLNIFYIPELAEKRPFFVGSRYGRSHVYGAKDLRQVNVAPRNDRFFLGSRYGKRSSPVGGHIDLNKETEQDNNNGADITYLACLHTGVSNLYRCYG